MSSEKWIVRRNKLKFAYEALYRDAANHFEISSTAAWVLYTLMDSDGEITQQGLREKWNFPKQTVNSAILKLQKEGYLNLENLQGSRNKKIIRLTDKGVKLLNNTMRLLADAEEQAAECLTEEEREQYLYLSNRFYEALCEKTKNFRDSTSKEVIICYTGIEGGECKSKHYKN